MKPRTEALTDGVITGLILGLVECLAVYGFGSAPTIDAAFILGFDLAAGVAAGFAFVVLASAAPLSWGRSEPRRLVLLLCVLAYLSARNPFAGSEMRNSLWASPWIRWGGSALVAMFASYSVTRRSLGTKDFARVTAVVQGGAVLLLGLRSAHPDAIGEMYGLAGAMKAVAISLGLMAFIIAVFFRRTSVARGRESYVAQGFRVATWAVAGFLWLLSVAAPQPGPPATRAAQDQPANKDRPNVLLIVLDTVRADHLSLYGYSRRTSPGLEAFAEHATTFSFAHSTAPFTLSSHASMFTGQLPSEHGSHHVPLATKDGDFRLAAGTETLASRLADKGYRTGAVVANTGYLGPWTGLAQGFHDYKSRPLRQYGYVPAYLSVLHRVSEIDANALLLKSVDARFVTNQAMGWMERHREAPFFLFVNYFDAHDPYRPPAPFNKQYFDSAASSGDALGGWPASQYDGEIAFLDAELGRLFRWLDETKIADRTLVIVTSDHGEGFGEHGCHGHSNSLYEELLHVPLVVRLPGQNNKSQSEAAVSLRSIPTIVDMTLAGERDPASLSTRLATSESRLIAEHWFSTGNANNCVASSHGPVIRAVFDDRRKLIQTASVEELYDLAEDPGERRDLFRTHPESARESRRSVLLPQIPELGAIVNGRPGTKPARPDEVTWERLRALGYVK